MSKGVLLFAFNIEKVNYYEMAVCCAKRINHFLNLPVTIVTDNESLPVNSTYQFDNVIIADSDSSNRKQKDIWKNKGRYRAYELTPYDETLLLDTDYLVNSDQLNKLFELYDDFMCAHKISFLMSPHDEKEYISNYSFDTLWATVIIFRKSIRAQQIFECLKMVQLNYSHYAKIYQFSEAMFRNDYALTIALRIVNGQTFDKKDYMPWRLVHLGKETIAYRINDTDMNTEYMLMTTDKKEKSTYTIIKDTDFHCMSKGNFMELVDE